MTLTFGLGVSIGVMLGFAVLIGGMWWAAR